MGSFSLDDVRRVLGEGRDPKSIDEHDTAAAVSMVLRDASTGPQVLLIRRAEHPTDPWSGHMAFPGGRQDTVDSTLLSTAIRETAEEVGLDLSAHGEHIGRLDDIQAVGRGRRLGMIVRPFVFHSPTDFDLKLDTTEVAEALWADLLPMFRGDVNTTRPYTFEGNEISLPGYDVEGRVVWGLTYHMLRTFFRMLKGQHI